MPNKKNKKTTNDSKALPLSKVLVFDYKPTIESINGLMKQSAESVLKIGEVLFDARTEATRLGAKDDYTAMFTHLRFTKETGDKFIAMYTDANIKNYIQHCPPFWNSIYKHLRGWSTEEWDRMTETGGLNFMSTSEQIYELQQHVLTDRKRVKEEAEARKTKALEKEIAEEVKLEEAIKKKDAETNSDAETKSDDTPAEDYVPKGTSNVSEKLKDADIKVDAEKKDEELAITYDGYSEDIINIGLNVHANSNTTKETLSNVNKFINDISSYAEDKIKSYNLSDYCVVGMIEELTATELGITLEDNTSKEDDGVSILSHEQVVALQKKYNSKIAA